MVDEGTLEVGDGSGLWVSLSGSILLKALNIVFSCGTSVARGARFLNELGRSEQNYTGRDGRIGFCRCERKWIL